MLIFAFIPLYSQYTHTHTLTVYSTLMIAIIHLNATLKPEHTKCRRFYIPIYRVEIMPFEYYKT